MKTLALSCYLKVNHQKFIEYGAAFFMTSSSAEKIVRRLQQETNLLRVEHHGNTKIWFSNEVPADLPIGSKTRNIFTENVALPSNQYCTITDSLTGSLIYWKHLGPRCMAAGAFVSIRPLHSGKAIATIELSESENNDAENSKEFWEYGFDAQENVRYLCKGLADGLLTPLIRYPLADIKISIFNTLTHKVDSSSKAFEVLGNYLMEAMISEFFKRDWLKSP